MGKNLLETLQEQRREEMKSKLYTVGLSSDLADILIEKYTGIGEFNDGFAEVQNENNLLGIISTNGSEIIPPMYNYIKMIDNAFLVGKGELFGIIDLEGNIISEPKYTYISEFQNGFAIVKDTNNKYCFINTNGEEICNKYDYAEDFENGIAIIGKNATWRDGVDWKVGETLYGFINEEGKEVAQPIYDDIGEFINGEAPAVKNGQSGKLLLNGRFIKDKDEHLND